MIVLNMVTYNNIIDHNKWIVIGNKLKHTFIDLVYLIV